MFVKYFELFIFLLLKEKFNGDNDYYIKYMVLFFKFVNYFIMLFFLQKEYVLFFYFV